MQPFDVTVRLSNGTIEPALLLEFLTIPIPTEDIGFNGEPLHHKVIVYGVISIKATGALMARQLSEITLLGRNKDPIVVLNQ